MGIIGDFFDFISKRFQDHQEKMEEYRRRYEHFDSDSLLHFYRSSNTNASQKIVIAKILHERGDLPTQDSDE